MLGALTAIGPFTVDLYLPAFPQLVDEFQVSEGAIQATLAGTMLGFAFGQLLMGPLSDRFGRKWPLIISNLLHIVASVFAIIAPDIITLTLSRVLQGFGAAAGSVVSMAIVRDLFEGVPLVRMLSRLSLVSGIAPILAPLIGSQLLLVVDWHGVFAFLLIYGILVLIAVISFVEETLTPEKKAYARSHSQLQRYKKVLSDHVYIGALILAGMNFTGVFSYLQASPFLLQDQYGLNAQQYGFFFASNSLGVMIGVQLASRLAVRFGPGWILAFTTAAQFIFAGILFFGEETGQGLWWTAIALFLYMTTCGAQFPLIQVLALAEHGNEAGTASSLIGASNFGIAGLLSPLVGILAGAGMLIGAAMATVQLGSAAIAILALWILIRPKTVKQLK